MKKTRNAGYGSPHWLGDKWVAAIAEGAHASNAAAQELADEVRTMRERRSMYVAEMRLIGELLRAKYGDDVGAPIVSMLCKIATAEEVYGNRGSRR